MYKLENGLPLSGSLCTAVNVNEVPVVVLNVNDAKSLEFSIVENVQRQDLDPIEEARGYQRLMDDFDYNYVTLDGSQHAIVPDSDDFSHAVGTDFFASRNNLSFDAIDLKSFKICWNSPLS